MLVVISNSLRFLTLIIIRVIMLLLHKNQLLRNRLSGCLKCREVNTTRQIWAFELYIMVSSIDLSIHQLRNLLTKCIVDGHRHVSSRRESVTDRCTWIERIRVILLECELRRCGYIYNHALRQCSRTIQIDLLQPVLILTRRRNVAIRVRMWLESRAMTLNGRNSSPMTQALTGEGEASTTSRSCPRAIGRNRPRSPAL